MQIATLNNNNPRQIQKIFQYITGTPVRLLNHFLEASLTNSNPILHPVRLYSIFHSWSENQIYEDLLPFYSNWDNDSSELLISCDEEFQKILNEVENCLHKNNNEELMLKLIINYICKLEYNKETEYNF